MEEKTVMEQLIGEAIYAQRSLSRDLLFEVYGKAKMAYRIEVITFREFMDINEMTVYFANTHVKELEHTEWESFGMELFDK